MTGHVVAVVPVRSFRHGKTRLAPALDPAERAAVMRRMAEGVTRALAALSAIDSTVIVSPDPEVLTWAASLSQPVLPVEQSPDGSGLDAAIEQGRQLAIRAGANAFLSLFADLPLLAPEDIAEVLARPAQVVLGGDRRGTGTNALLLRLTPPANEFTFSFGAGSLARHLVEARRLGLSAEISATPGIAFDLDTPDDWSDLLSRTADDPAAVDWRQLACGVSAR